MAIKECSLYTFNVKGTVTKTTPKDITARKAVTANDTSILCPATPIVPTLDNGSHSSAYGGCYYYKVGSRVTIHIAVSGLTANTTTNLWTLPTGYIPHSRIRAVGMISSWTASYARIGISDTGTVTVNSDATTAIGELSFDAFS